MSESIKRIRDQVMAMANNPIRNYVTPGLTSSLVGGAFCTGKVRLFTSDRNTRDWVAPHSHRFDFTCLVLSGSVENIVFESAYNSGDSFCPGTLTAKSGGMGGYEFESSYRRATYIESAATYTVGDSYGMIAKQIHSIRFSRGAEVLFFEGPEVTDKSTVLEPWSNGGRVATFQTAPWMFERLGDASPSTSKTGEQP